MSVILAKVRRLLLFFIAEFLGVQPVMALSSADYLKYSQNDIYFYTPGGCINASDVRGNSNGSDVFLIGDSISVNSQSQIKKELPNIKIDALSGTYFSHNDDTFGPGGTERISAMGDQDILVFAMGTNGGIDYIYKDDTEKLFAALNGRNTKVILMTIYYSDNYSLSQMDNSNEVVKQLAEQYSNISVMDWAAVAGSDPGKYISSDHIHPTDEGKTKFAETVRDAVNKISNVGSQTIDGTGDYSSIMSAKNANESVFNVSRDSEWWAGWGDGNVEQMTRVLDHYGDLAYQTGKAVGVPWVGILVQMRYEDSASVCGANNFWGNGCSGSHTGVGGASIQGENLGEGFVQYAKTITNGYHNKALGISDPVEFLDALAPTWIGTGNLYNMKNSVESMLNFIETPEGQAIVSQFGTYTGANTVTGASRQICSNGTNYTNGNGVTLFDFEGHQYAFPIAYATKENYLSNNNKTMMSSKYIPGPDQKCTGKDNPPTEWITCLSQPDGWGHHDYPAVDLGIMMEMVDGLERSDKNTDKHWGGDSAQTDERFYLTSGAQVVAVVDGTIAWTKDTYVTNGVPEKWQSRCGSMSLKGNDGHEYYYTHISSETFQVAAGQTVTAGQPLAEIGAPYCAQSTQAHLHLDMDGWLEPKVDGNGNPLFDANGNQLYRRQSIDIKPLIRAGYASLPANAAELARREAAANDIKESGLTYEQAKDFMINYGANRDSSSENAVGSHLWGLCGGGGSNCVTFSAFFLNKFTSASASEWPNGKNVVNTLRGRGIETGDTPEVWAVFSWDNGNDVGHTGVILGYHDGKWIVGHASCDRGDNGNRGAGNGTEGGGGSGVVVIDSDIIKAIWGSSAASVEYAYLADEVDMSAINDYLANGV